MSIDFHRLIEAIDNNLLFIIDYVGFHRLGTPGIYKRINIEKKMFYLS